MLASLLISTFLFGRRLTVVKEIAGMMARRAELKRMLALLQSQVEDEDALLWREHVKQDTAERDARILKIESKIESSERVFSDEEETLIAEGLALGGLFQDVDEHFRLSSSSMKSMKSMKSLRRVSAVGKPTRTVKMKNRSTIERVLTTFDEHGRCSAVHVRAVIRGATPQHLCAWLLEVDSWHLRSLMNPKIDVQCVIDPIHELHTCVFYEKRSKPLRNRTFLNSVLCNKVSNEGEPPSFVLVAVPIEASPRIPPELMPKNSVRAQLKICWQFTLEDPNTTRVTFAASLDMKGDVPGWFTDSIAIPQLVNQVCTMQVGPAASSRSLAHPCR